jgi:hypothetical protein
VTVAQIKKSGSGTLQIKVVALAKHSPIALVPPNPGTSACMLFEIGGGDRYHVLLPPAPASRITKNDAKTFQIKNALNEGLCPETVTTTTSTTSTSTSTSSTTSSTTTTSTAAPTTTTTTTAAPTTTTTSTTVPESSTTTSSTTTTSTTLPPSGNWTSSMLALWKMDDATGSTRVNAQGTTERDLIDVAQNVPAETADKMEGSASCNFSDSPAMELYTQNADAALRSPAIANGLSWGCWARDTPNGSSTSPDGLLGSYSGPDSAGYAIDYQSSTTSWRAWTYNGASQVIASASGAQSTWTHVVGTLTGTNDLLTLYLNGAQAAQTPHPSPSYQNSDKYVTVGQVEIAGDVGFTGNADECFVANRTLTAGDVCKICSCGVDGLLCTCSGASYNSTGRNATDCGNCDLGSVACDQGTPN